MPKTTIYMLVIALGVGTHALSWFMVSTTAPSIIFELGGAQYVQWITIAFLATSIISGITGGFLNNRFGAYKVIIGGTLLFTVGSICCFLASNLTIIFIGRALQGSGEGAIMALSYILVKELFNNDGRLGRVYALLSIIYSLSAFLGPILASLVETVTTWRYVFLIGLVPSCLLIIFSHISVRYHHKANISSALPIWRIILASLAIICLTSAQLHDMVWASMLGGIVFFILFIRQDKKHSHNNLLAYDAFSFSTVVGRIYWLVILLPVAISAVHIYIPLFAQVIYGVSVVTAGYMVNCLAFAWSSAALLVRNVTNPLWMRFFIIIGPCAHVAGMLLLYVAFTQHVVWLTFAGVIFIGGGFGLCWTFLNYNIMHYSSVKDSNVSISIVPTLQSLGYVIGGTLVSMVATNYGVQDPIIADRLIEAASYIFPLGASLSAMLVALACSVAWMISKSAKPSL